MADGVDVDALLELANRAATESPNRVRQVGAALLTADGRTTLAACNAFPEGVRNIEERHQGDEPWLWIEHAERNGICNAARAGTATEGCTIYVEIMPCMDCARAIVQAGIVQVVVSSERMAQYSSAYYDEHFGMTEVLFAEAKVKVRRV